MSIPVSIVAVLIAFLLGSLGGYQHGKKVQRGEAAEEVSAALQALIKNHNKLSAVDAEEATKAEAARQKSKLQAMERKNRVLEDALSKAKPACDRDPESFGLLIESIRAANRATSPASGSLLTPLFGHPGAEGRQGLHPAPVDRRPD